jgi:hypothetical protein
VAEVELMHKEVVMEVLEVVLVLLTFNKKP